jgi:hypothetical protein
MIQRTSTCARFEHPEFRICFDPKIAIEPDVQWFLHGLEQSVANGERFSNGQTFQVGWMLTLIRENEEGSLSILEPDMKQFPIAWVDSVSHTLSQLRTQKDVVESVLPADELCFPSILESAIICNRLGKTHNLLMDRSTLSNRDSGWFCGCREVDHHHNDVEQLTRVSLFEAAVKYHSGIIPFLALPVGSLVGLKERVLTIFRGEDQLAFRLGSYLHRVFGEQGE